MMTMKQKVCAAASLLALISTSGCNYTTSIRGLSSARSGLAPQTKALSMVSDTGDDDGGTLGDGEECEGDCKAFNFIQSGPVDGEIKKLDILFVTDTSGSLAAEKRMILDQIYNFAKELPSTLDLQWGVMLGHGSTSANSGVLYAGNPSSVPRILSSRSAGYSNATLMSFLTTNLYNAPGDSGSDGGEELFYSLSKALDSGYTAMSPAATQTQDFFRSDAALAVIFVTDENDICFPLDLNGRPATSGDYKPDNDNSELPAYYRDCKVNGSNAYTPALVLQRLKARKGRMPVALAGIIHNNLATVPAADEDAIGHGIVELLELAGGISVDIADPNYASHLSQIGRMTASTLTYRTEFEIPVAHISDSTVEVYVDGVQIPATVREHDSSATVVIAASDVGHAGSKIDIVVCKKAEDRADRDEDELDSSQAKIISSALLLAAKL